MPIIATVTPADSRALTTVERLKAEVGDLGVTDARLEVAIGRATAQLERWCGRVFARETVREVQHLSVGCSLWLQRAPVLEIESITINDVELEANDYELVDPEHGQVAMQLTVASDLGMSLGYELGGGMPYGYRRETTHRVEIEYTAGWVLPPDDEADLPADLEGACVELVRQSIDQQSKPAGLQSERLGDASWTYAKSAGGMSEEALALAAPYRRVAI